MTYQSRRARTPCPPLLRKALIGISAAGVAVAALSTPAALAVHDEGFSLEATIDGNPTDWIDLFDVDGSGTVTNTDPLPAGFLDASFKDDYYLPDSSGYATGTKDTLSMATGWQCKTPNNLGAKFDILNAYAAAYSPTSGADQDDLIVYFGSEIASPNGNRNAGLWLLKDPSAACSGAGNTDWTGTHTDGDVFIVAAFTNGGSSANIDVYRWSGTDATGGLVLQDSFANAVCGPGLALEDDACAIANTDGDKNANEAQFAIDTPWPPAGDRIEATFIEGAINLTDLGLNGCFSTFVANSRSSQELGATLHDFATDQFNTCGTLEITKFVDYDGDGIQDLGDGAGDWAFTVTGPAPSTDVVCSGSTGADGVLDCGTLATGSYTVTETQITGYYNTKAGATVAVDDGATVSTTVQVAMGGAVSVSFGNICYVSKVLEVTGVPTDNRAPASITAQYDVNNSGTFTDLALVDQGDGSWKATLTGLRQTDLVDWRYYIGDATTRTRAGDDDESMQAGNPTDPNGTDRTAGCSITNSDTYPSVTVSGFKYKDADADGVDDAAPADPGLGGFDFTLSIGTSTYGTDTSSSAAADLGQYSFTDVYPGTYTVAETDQAHWYQTQPAGNATNRTVTVYLDSTSATVGAFGNTPLSDFAVTFADLTGATDSTISCTGPSQGGAGGTLDTPQTDDSYAGDEVIVGTYTCTIVVVDP